MSWLWQPKPGMRRVHHRELIRLLGGALKAAELEAEKARLTREARLLEAEVRASQLLAERRTAAGEVEASAHAEVMSSLPLTADGVLHEAAFLALVEARVWQHRERELAAVIAADNRS